MHTLRTIGGIEGAKTTTTNTTNTTNNNNTTTTTTITTNTTNTNTTTTGLRDILARTTNIKDLPADIWSSHPAATCAAGSSGGANAAAGKNKLLLPALLAGSTSLVVERSKEPGWVKVQLDTTGSGWLGFGVADPGGWYHCCCCTGCC
jgi:hypothetical protein